MFRKIMLADRIGAFLSIIFGAVAISEAVRLYPKRMGPLVGDYTMPAVFGSVLILLGLLLLFVVKGEQFKVKYPDRKTMISILSTLGLLFLYWFSIQFLGYEITTFVVGIGLFKVMGSYSWIKAIIFSAILSTVLYFLFIFWLGVPFPTGIFGI